jgi:hypothetical protein
MKEMIIPNKNDIEEAEEEEEEEEEPCIWY